MPHVLFSCAGGHLVRPDAVLVGRDDGGHLVVDPPRRVWDRIELHADELRDWGCLVAAAGAAMLAELPVLEGGCINYWDAGNWALHADADPPGPKTGRAHRTLHLHLPGRSPRATDPDLRWGEAPRFPAFAARHAWAAAHVPLTDAECGRIARATERRLREAYGFDAARLRAPAA
jgi:hypothetical protein